MLKVHRVREFLKGKITFHNRDKDLCDHTYRYMYVWVC